MAARFVSDRRLYLTADDRVVEEGDPAARSLLVGEGGEVDAETVKKYDLKHLAAPDAAPAEDKAEVPATDNKLSVKAPANKAKE